jgi:hypothetical protein
VSRAGFAHARACCNVFCCSVVLCCALLLKCCKCCKCCSKTFATFTTFFTTFATTTHKTVARDTTYIHHSVMKNAFSCRRTVHCSMHMTQMSNCVKHSQPNKHEEAQCTLIGDRSFSHSANSKCCLVSLSTTKSAVFLRAGPYPSVRMALGVTLGENPRTNIKQHATCP